jgi:hypothetical protein
MARHLGVLAAAGDAGGVAVRVAENHDAGHWQRRGPGAAVFAGDPQVPAGGGLYKFERS